MGTRKGCRNLNDDRLSLRLKEEHFICTLREGIAIEVLQWLAAYLSGQDLIEEEKCLGEVRAEICREILGEDDESWLTKLP